ncbi:hypothetical protein [Cellulomonas fimi]|uniref:Uncharacterized protein n=1 Tax=Cellulomonas fimi (strain ATCC 484 / DSM 20113 / JCM 1341 / CCUG 24087 / LMG 16345 / NBRC 15513 / NCIMB 8980 / NCTC 7547 / NRS-133) TaxID=590998 RepID=F4GYP8_CELFA|nr:hypothetical protein [Cellulomonas fimi]AEE44767.1 hypothetical protein Celf_0627 [Cellulomonas fimi ATCC 484]NNH06092.1 hypothetical protein [Cellulomonas fimi]VEH27238.1 Uncharacterised protein [Cellulomonas fimi]
MASSKFSTRKGLAVGLAVLGVAGLSLASASQLSSQWQSTTQAGTVDVDAACQKAATGTVKVKYDAPALGASGYAPTQVQLSNIDGDCKGKTIRVAWKTGAGTYTALGTAQTLSATLTTADTVSFALPAATDYNTIAAFAVSIDG